VVDGVLSGAIASLTAALQSLLPDVADPALRPTVHVIPLRIVPAGVGAYIGLSQDPLGEVRGRRVEATATVTARAESIAGLDQAVSQVSEALVLADRATLASSGLLRVTLDEVGPLGDAPARDVTFNVLYEHLALPTAGEGVIERVPLDLTVGVGGRKPKVLFRADFSADPLPLFEVVDDARATRNRPSQWEHDAAGARVVQRSNIWGGSSAVNANKPGTYLVLRTDPRRPPVRDFILRATLQSTDDDGMGVVFRWQDEENFYFFLMDAAHRFRLFGKKAAGEFQELEAAAADTTQGYEAGTVYDLRLTAVGPDFEVYLNDRLALRGRDSSLAEAGRVGFFCRNNADAAFSRLELIQT
jgi:hypothetical protein